MIKRILILLGFPLSIAVFPLEVVYFSVRWVLFGKTFPDSPLWYCWMFWDFDNYFSNLRGL